MWRLSFPNGQVSPLQQLEKKESQRLLELEALLHERVVGQDEAVEAVSRAIRRARSGLKDLIVR